MDENRTWIIYCRVSSKKQEKEWVSLEDQNIECRKYCKNNWIHVIWVYKETYSWKSSNRPILKEAFLNAKENKVWYFIIFDIDRFSREGFWGYSNLKEDLEKSWIKLKDSKYIIWEKVIQHENELVDMSKYAWNYENSSEYAEVMVSTQAKMERKKILQRTIPREIKYEQAWYQVRQSNYWYKNKKIQTIEWKEWKRTIQVKHQIEWDFVIEMYKNKAEWVLSNDEIVKNINLAWCKTRHWWKMTPKYMNELLIKPIYAWIIVTKWTWNKPIKASYEWLINIETWNKANKWKIKIIELWNNKFDILYYDKKKEEEVTSDEREIQSYKKNDDNEYKFRWFIAPPFLRNRNFKWSAWRWRKDDRYYPKYHFTYNDEEVKKFNLKQKYYWLDKDVFEKTIYNFFNTIELDKEMVEIFIKIMKEIWDKKKTEYIEIENNKIKEIKKLKNKEQEIIEAIKSLALKSKIDDFEDIISSFKDDKEKIKKEINELENSKKDVNDDDFETFKNNAIYFVEHLWKIVKVSQKQSELDIIFKLVFTQKPTYNEIESGTAQIYPIFSYLKQQKNPSEDEFCQNTQWHPHKESNLAHRIWNPGF